MNDVYTYWFKDSKCAVLLYVTLAWESKYVSFADTFNIGLYFGLDKPILGKFCTDQQHKPAKNCRRNQKRNTEKPKGLGWAKSGKTSGRQFFKYLNL